jgi:hypothetical protein
MSGSRLPVRSMLSKLLGRRGRNDAVLLSGGTALLHAWKRSDKTQRALIGRTLLACANGAARTTGFKGRFDELIRSGAAASIAQAGTIAEALASEALGVSGTGVSLIAEGHAAVALLCYGYLGGYRTDRVRQALFEDVARLYSLLAVRDAGSEPGPRQPSG